MLMWVGSLGLKGTASSEHTQAQNRPTRGGRKIQLLGSPCDAAWASWSPVPQVEELWGLACPPLAILQVGNLRAQTMDCLARGHTTGTWQPRVALGHLALVKPSSMHPHAPHFSVRGFLTFSRYCLGSLFVVRSFILPRNPPSFYSVWF